MPSFLVCVCCRVCFSVWISCNQQVQAVCEFLTMSAALNVLAGYQRERDASLVSNVGD